MNTVERKARRLQDIGFVRVTGDRTAKMVKDRALELGIRTVVVPPYGPHEGYELRVVSRETPAREEA